jgi:cyclopropane-fatty-acyl-phospholipid synthase
MSAPSAAGDRRDEIPATGRRADHRAARAAARILALVFGNVPFGFAVRLWNGARVHLGPAGEPFTLVFRSREAFRRLVLRPNTLRFAVAFADGELDVEGDLFTAVGLANRIEALELTLRDRLAILGALTRI